MKALLFGAGKISRGFLAQLLKLNDVEIVFIEKVQGLVDLLNERKEYEVHILGNESKNTKITDFRAIPFDDIDAIAREMKDADIAFTSVVGKNLIDLGNVIGRAFLKSGMNRQGNNILNLITCENWKHPIQDLKEGILRTIPEEKKEYLWQNLSVTEAVIMRIAVEPSKENKEKYPLDVWVQDFWELPVNKEFYKGEFPKFQYIYAKDGFGTLLEQKMFTNNTSNAGIAYLGYLLGYDKVADAANAAEISKFLDQLYPEINHILEEGLGVSKEEQESFAKKAREKYSNPLIVDEISRQAKDPIRKLGPEDRLVAPANMAFAHGIVPKCIAKIIAAAVYYDHKEDESAQKLQEKRKTEGFEKVLTDICKIKTGSPLFELVMEERKDLLKKGWIKDE